MWATGRLGNATVVLTETLTRTPEVIRSTLSAVAGQGSVFATDGPLRHAHLVIDSDARVPDSVEVLTPGRRVDALVRQTAERPESGIRRVCVKLPDVYGPGRDQDFLFASSGDGAPLHHVTLPASETGTTLYSGLWLYLAGWRPVVFGLRSDAATQDRFEFTVGGVIGRFQPIGHLELGDEAQNHSGTTFAARNSGGNLRPLPPAMFYRTES